MSYECLDELQSVSSRNWAKMEVLNLSLCGLNQFTEVPVFGFDGKLGVDQAGKYLMELCVLNEEGVGGMRDVNCTCA